MRVMNFGAGPGALPLAALREAQDELLDFNGVGASVMEISHRSKPYDALHAEVLASLRTLLRLPDSHTVLLLQGGASAHFAQIPLVFLPKGARAGYVVNGTWGRKALSEASKIPAMGGGEAFLLASSEDAAHNAVRVVRADEVHADQALAYVHYTSNETIHGIEYGVSVERPLFEAGDVPVVCDVSSNFLSRPTDFSSCAFAYAGAQKNAGPSGLVIAIVDKSFLDRGRRDLPNILRYDVQLKEDSRLNTPPTFSVYMLRNVLRWIEREGGLAAMEARNVHKAAAIYQALDVAGAFYDAPVERESRSRMNVVFRLRTPALEAAFLEGTKAAGMMGLAGHRQVGGIRVSLYNAIEPAWADALAQFIGEFAVKHG